MVVDDSLSDSGDAAGGSILLSLPPGSGAYGLVWAVYEMGDPHLGRRAGCLQSLSASAIFCIKLSSYRQRKALYLAVFHLSVAFTAISFLLL